TFSHRLPADMVVTNEKHRDICEKHWQIPAGTIPAKVGLHAVARKLAHSFPIQNSPQTARLQRTYPLPHLCQDSPIMRVRRYTPP
ncbi:hypothetical protein MJI46_33860, partial [Salmonella enterica subsp. enterica serovar Cerro]|nr:hypothetical protein [Salmonella enterica subsp. enterica serovar Cerro]